MNRIIKFRAWHKKQKIMYEINRIYPYQDEDTRGGEVFLKGRRMPSFYFPEQVELLQYTGIKDKNNKDIYEGDIVNLSGYGLYVAEFPFIQLYESSFENDICDVIGNIYENEGLI